MKFTDLNSDRKKNILIGNIQTDTNIINILIKSYQIPH